MYKEENQYTNGSRPQYSGQPQNVNPQPQYVNQQAQYVNPQAQYVSQQPQYVNPQTQYASQQVQHVNQQVQYVNQQTQYVNQQAQYANPQPRPGNQPEKKKSRVPMIILLVVLLAAFGVGGYFGAKLLFDKESNDTKKETVSSENSGKSDWGGLFGKKEEESGSSEKPDNNGSSTELSEADYSEDEDALRPFPERMPEPAEMKGLEDIELCEAIDDGTRYLTKDWLDEHECLEEEKSTEAAELIYEWSQTLVKEGVIEGSALCEEADTVSFFLISGLDFVYVPTIEGKYSGGGDFSVVSIGTLPVWNDKMVSAANPIDTSGAVESAMYILNNMAEYTTHMNIPQNEGKVYAIRDFLQNVSNYNARVIFWRGHGAMKINRNGEITIGFELNEKAKKTKKETYSDELYPSGDALPTVVVGSKNKLFLTQEFFEKYLAKTDGGVFITGICHGAQDDGRLARIFFDRGFDAYIGATDEIGSVYSDEMLGAIAENLCKKDENDRYYTIKDAFLEAKQQKGTTDGKGVNFWLYQNPETNPFRLLPYELKAATGNAGQYVIYGGKTFFNRYSLNNVAAEGVFGYFPTNYTLGNEFCSIDKDGKTKEIYQVTTSQNLAVFENSFVFEEVNSDYPECSFVYSVERNTKKRSNVTNGKMVATVPRHGLVAIERDGGYAIFDAVRNLQLIVDADNPSFVLYHKGWMYYTTTDSGKNVLLHAYDMLNEKSKDYGIISTPYNDGIYDLAMNVIRAQVTDTGIVFLCGAYAGSGIILQKASFAYLNFENDTASQALSGFDHNEYCVTDDFYISGDILYAALTDPKTYEKGFVQFNMVTEEISVSDYHEPYSLGKSFKENGSYHMYVADDNVRYTFLPADRLAVVAEEMGVPAGGSGYTVEVSQACCVGGYIYYTVTTGKKDPSLDIGWREGGRLIARRVYRYNYKKDVTELVYEY